MFFVLYSMVQKLNHTSQIVFLSTFPPRECGIASFTQDLANSFNDLFAPHIESKVVAMNVDEVSGNNYPNKVIYTISQNRRDQYRAIARQLNDLPQVKIVSIQHEFGIFGGDWGEYVLEFAEELTKPLIITFHTVLPKPKKKMLLLVRALGVRAEKVTVMTKRSKHILEKIYGIPAEKIAVIPHGIHSGTFIATKTAKATLGLSQYKTLSSFGLLGRGKGLEYAIEALPKIAAKYPNVRLLILGATHPVVLRQSGEEYRNFLKQKVSALGMNEYVRFYDKYLSLRELLMFLRATDIYLAVSQNPDQAVSGTLSYALGAGRPVIATAFAQAQEDITHDVGRLVNFKESKGIMKATLELLDHEELRVAMGRSAYFKTRPMVWPNVVIAYMKLFSALAPELRAEAKHLPKIKLGHIVRMTTDVGILQFSKLSQPNPSSGYTVDDNARALIAMVSYYTRYKSPIALKLATIYLNFLEYTQTQSGYFNNYVQFDKQFSPQNTQENMEDPTARALHALVVTATTSAVPKKLKEKAAALFLYSSKKQIAFTHLRSNAFYAQALACWLTIWPQPKLTKQLERACTILVTAYAKTVSPDWQWFEHQLTYANAALPEALLAGYKITGKKIYLKTAHVTLEFLISKTFRDSMYVPIGQAGWHIRGERRALHDQQPEDPAAMVQTLNTMFAISGDRRYKTLQHTAFDWFLGDNTLSQVVYDQTTGGCYDGLQETRLNLNQGAESTISYLLARLLF